MYFNYNIIYYCRYPADWVPPHTSFKPRQGTGRASVHCHMPPQVASCPTALDPASLLKRAPVLSRIPRLQTPAFMLGKASTLPCVLQLRTSLLYSGGLWCCYMSHGFKPCLPAQEDSDAATCPAAPNPVIPAREGFGAGTCLVTLRGPHALRIKKKLSWHAYTARLTCFQGVTICFQDA
jgi:hypothetical protein